MRRIHVLATSVAILLTACAAQPVPHTAAPSQALVPSPPPPSATPAPMPQRTEDARAAQTLVMAWQARGLQAEAAYDPSPARIEWRVIRCILPSDARAADRVASEAAAFAARVGHAARIEIVAKNHREDLRLSRAVKNGALASGGRNKVKLDHVITADRPRQILVDVWR